MFSLSIDKPDVLHSRIVEIAERVTLEAWTESKQPESIDIASDSSLKAGITGEIVRILKPIGKKIMSPFTISLAFLIFFRPS